MKNPTANQHHTTPSTQDDVARRLRLRYFASFVMKVILPSILIFIMLWMVLELLFPRLIRAESTMAPAAGSIEQMEIYPLSTPTAPMGEGLDGIVVKYTVRPAFYQSQSPDQLTEAAEYPATELKLASPGADFELLYAGTVEFYKETPSLTIAQFLDHFRAPDAAKDQLPMQLYDVDVLSAEAYEYLLDDLGLMLQTPHSHAEGDGKGSGTPSILGFVMAADQSSSQPAASATRTSEFIGVPVVWNEGLSDLLQYVTGHSDLYKQNKNFIKASMFAVLASADDQAEPSSGWFAESKEAKIYLALPSTNIPRHNEILGLDPIPAVSFRSAWDTSLR